MREKSRGLAAGAAPLEAGQTAPPVTDDALSQCLLRCPFCGSGEQRILRDVLGFSIHCDDDSCGVRTPSCGTLEIAASFWNRRSDVPDEIEDCNGVPGIQIGHLIMHYGACARCGMKESEVAAQRSAALHAHAALAMKTAAPHCEGEANLIPPQQDGR